MIQNTVVDTLPPGYRRAVRELARLLDGLFGAKLLGLTAFGPALDAGSDPTTVALETVMVVERIELAYLRGLAEQGTSLGRWGVAAPLAMTPDYIKESLDTFPLELLEIQQRRVTIAGQDFFQSLTPAHEHVRLQCEREFKRLLIRLRQGLLAAAGREDVLRELEADIARHLMRTLRGMLWLEGKKEYLPTEAVVMTCGEIVRRPLTGVREALRPGGEYNWAEFAALYEDVEALSALANRE